MKKLDPIDWSLEPPSKSQLKRDMTSLQKLITRHETGKPGPNYYHPLCRIRSGVLLRAGRQAHHS